jgi:hypothetical protein
MRFRTSLFYVGWAVLLLLPIAYVTQGLIIQDLPKIQMWQWLVPVVALGLIAYGRDHDDVLKHHVV